VNIIETLEYTDEQIISSTINNAVVQYSWLTADPKGDVGLKTITVPNAQIIEYDYLNSDTLPFVEKVTLVETWSRYDVAPLEEFQAKIGLIETPVAPLAGEVRVGAAGGTTMVVKLHPLDHALEPPAVFAFTTPSSFASDLIFSLY
jgi:hypothetical protein